MTQMATFFVPLGGGDELEALNAFLRGRRVLQIDRAFAGSGWAFCVEWLDGAAGCPSADWRARRIDYRAVLDEAAFARFAKLRARRKAIAAEDGVPPYLVMTDAQMAEAAKAGQLTAEVLSGLEGFGEARLKKYGERLLDLETVPDSP